MANEVRRIIFSHEESGAAIRAHGQKQGLKFPAGRLIRARFAGGSEYEFHSMKQYRAPIQSDYHIAESERAVTLTFFDETTLEQKYYNVTANFISSALIEFCIGNRIMIPKESDKSLDITEFNICMDINRQAATAQSNVLALDD